MVLFTHNGGTVFHDSCDLLSAWGGSSFSCCAVLQLCSAAQRLLNTVRLTDDYAYIACHSVQLPCNLLGVLWGGLSLKLLCLRNTSSARCLSTEKLPHAAGYSVQLPRNLLAVWSGPHLQLLCFPGVLGAAPCQAMGKAEGQPHHSRAYGPAG